MAAFGSCCTGLVHTPTCRQRAHVFLLSSLWIEALLTLHSRAGNVFLRQEGRKGELSGELQCQVFFLFSFWLFILNLGVWRGLKLGRDYYHNFPNEKRLRESNDFPKIIQLWHMAEQEPNPGCWSRAPTPIARPRAVFWKEDLWGAVHTFLCQLQAMK